MTDSTPPVSNAKIHRWWILVVLAVAQLMVVLDATIVNIALPEAQHALGFDDDSRQWVVTAYSLTFGGLLLLGGRINDLFGRKRSFVIGLVGFAAASALGGWGQSFEILVAARALQGIFGALLAPAALSLLTVTFADSKDRAKAFGIFGAISGAGGAIGLLLGGVLTEYMSWNWCLYVNVLFAVVAAVGAAVLVPSNESHDRSSKLDVPGTILVTGGLFALVYGLANSESDGWSDPWTLIFVAVGIALLALFIFIETRVPHPLLPLRVVLDRARGTSYLVMMISAIGMFGVFLFLTYFLQSGLGYSPVVTGVAFLPMVGALAATAAVLGNFTGRISPKISVAGSLVIAAGGMLYLTRIDFASDYTTDILPGLLLVGAGLGGVFATAMALATLGVTADDAGVASATVNTAQQIGGSIGISLLSSFAATAASDYVSQNSSSITGSDPASAMTAIQRGAELASYHSAFFWAAGFFVAGAAVAALLYPNNVAAPDTDTAPLLIH